MLLTTILAQWSQPTGKKVDYDNLVPVFPMADVVPHRIFQICLQQGGPIALSPAIKSVQEKMTSLNPGWEYQLVDYAKAEEIILQYYGSAIWHYFQRIDSHYGAAKADFLRYLIIYAMGGVYIDLKNYCRVPLNQSVHPGDTFILSTNQLNNHPEIPELNGKFYNNDFIIAAAGHPLLRNVIKEVLRRIDDYNPYTDGIGWHGTIVITGPALYSTVIGDYLSKHEGIRFCDTREVMGYTNTAEGAHKGAFVYQKQNGMTDYRKQTRPVVIHDCRLLNRVNRIYLSVLSHYMKRKESFAK